MGKGGSAHRAPGSGTLRGVDKRNDEGRFLLLMPASLFVLEQLPVLGGSSSFFRVELTDWVEFVCFSWCRFLPRAGSRSRTGRADRVQVPTGHERRQRPAVGHREKGSRDSLLFFFDYLGIE